MRGTRLPSPLLLVGDAAIRLSFSRRSARRPQQTFRSAKSRRLFLEALEGRALLAGDVASVLSGNMALPGDSGPAEGEDPPVVRFTIETLVPGTNTPITAITNGRDFDFRVTVQDLRDDGNPIRGVYAAYLDVLFDRTLAKVRVPEVQRLTLGGSTPVTGTFTLTLNPGQTTAPISYSRQSSGDLVTNATAIQTALNNLLGAGSVIVTQVFPQAAYDIRFVGQADIDQPPLQVSITGTTVVEIVKGNPNNANSFRDSFRSRDLGFVGGGASLYQSGLSAINGIDRIDELGAQLGSQSSLDTNVHELVRARMTATLPAGETLRTLIFTPDFSDLVHPTHDTLVYADLIGQEKGLVPQELIERLVANTLTISSALTAARGASLVDEDNAAGVDIPILPLVTKNPGAPEGAIELRSFTQPVGGTVVRLDNGTPTNFADDQVKFIPAANFNGTATFTYTAGIVGDPLAVDEATSTITVTVAPTNDAPENQVPGAQTTPEDTALVFNAANSNLIRATDIDADPAGIRVTLGVSAGVLSLPQIANLVFSQGTGTGNALMTFEGTTTAVNAALAGLTYQPPQNFSGSATLTITTSDLVAEGTGGLKQDQDTVTINVTPANDAPTVTAPAAQTAFTLNALVFAPAFNNAVSISDPDSGSDSIQVVVTATGGIGTLTATAAVGAQISGSGTSILTINGPLSSINAALNGLTLTPPATAASGTLTIAADDQGHNPGPAKTGQAVVAVSVAVPSGAFAVNDAPANLTEGSASYVIDVLANDLATGVNRPVIVSFTQPQIGTVTLDNNGTAADPTDDKLVYHPPLKNGLPDLDFFTPASLPAIGFSYVVNQSPAAGTDSPPGAVTIRIANAPDAPLAANDGVNNSYATSIGAPMSRTAAQGLLANDTSPDNAYGDPNLAQLTVVGATAGSPRIANTTAGGTVTVNVDGSFTYAPPTGFGGNDTFTYQAASSLGGQSNTATVTLHVSAPPTAGNDNFTTAQEDQVFTSPASVLLNDSDATDGESLEAVLVANVPAADGSVSLAPNGIFTYTPASNFNTTRPATAPTTFTYKVKTPNGRESAVATVSITVNETNDNPTALGDAFDAVQKTGSLGIDQLVGVVGNDSIAPDTGENLSVTALNGTAANGSGNTAAIPTTGGGSVRLEGFLIKYTSPGATGTDSFTYTVSDGRGGTSTATVQVNILPPLDYGDAPDTFGTLIFSNGARHSATGPRLGILRDVEGNGVSSPTANGDDLAGEDDEDGLTSYLLLRNKTSTLTVQVTADPSAKLDAWIDFNRNGTFEASEQVATSTTVNPGPNQISFTSPAAALLGDTIARLRLSTSGGLTSAGAASDGEVEDHVVTILQDLDVTLPSGNGLDRASVRRNGENIEVFNALAGSVIGTSPSQFTHAVIVNGSATEPDEITVDYAFGGLITLPGHIQLSGGAGTGDLLTIQGVASTSSAATYVSSNQSLGNATVRTTDGAAQSQVIFTNFEPLTINGMASFAATGNLNVNGDTLTLNIASPATLPELGARTNLEGGTINAPGGLHVGADRMLRGQGTVNGPVSGDLESIIEATGPLTLGSATSNTGFTTRGELRVGSHSVTLLSAAPAQLGFLTSLGAGGVGGTLTSESGLVLNTLDDDTLEGLGTVNTPNAAGQAVTNNGGTIRGNSAGEKLTLSGYIKGTGFLDNVIITGTYDPGNSPAAVQLGSVSFAATAKLIIELGGKTPGAQFDQLNFTGAAVLGGTLEVNLLNGLVPAIPDSFNIMNATAGITGSFAASTLPALAGKQRWWDTTPVNNQVNLLVSPTHPRHNPRHQFDVTDDGFVVAADVLEIINFINAFRSQAIAPSPSYINPFIDVNGDNFVAANDSLDIINRINAGFGGRIDGEGEGEGEADSSLAALALVPATTPAAAASLADTIALLASDLVEAATRRKK